MKQIYGRQKSIIQIDRLKEFGEKFAIFTVIEGGKSINFTLAGLLVKALYK